MAIRVAQGPHAARVFGGSIHPPYRQAARHGVSRKRLLLAVCALSVLVLSGLSVARRVQPHAVPFLSTPALVLAGASLPSALTPAGRPAMHQSVTAINNGLPVAVAQDRRDGY